MTVATAPKKVERKAPKRAHEFDSRSVPPKQRAAEVQPPIDMEWRRDPEIIIPEKDLTNDHYERLKFAEEPVMIIIHRSSEKHAPRCTDLISINNIKAEMLLKNGWVMMGNLPRGFSFITKRKYVEVLARSKQDLIDTVIMERESDNPRNVIEHNVVATCSFSVLEDKNPRGAEWLANLLHSA